MASLNGKVRTRSYLNFELFKLNLRKEELPQSNNVRSSIIFNIKYMGKNAVYGHVNILDYDTNNELKRLSLLFDRVYVIEPNDFERFIEHDKNVLIKEYDFLQKNQIIELYARTITYIPEFPDLNKSIKTIDDQLARSFPPMFNGILEDLSDMKKQLTSLKEKLSPELSNDFYVRVEALALTKRLGADFFPVVGSNSSFSQKEKKSNIVYFLLSQIPQPDNTVQWEKIIEFRSDFDVKNSYLALINWINEIAVSTFSTGEIIEKYEYLYNNYIKHYNLHKIKSKNTKLEIIVSAGTDFLLSLASGHFISPLSSYIKMNISEVNLLQEEANLPGKEIAYIFKTNETFTR